MRQRVQGARIFSVCRKTYQFLCHIRLFSQSLNINNTMTTFPIFKKSLQLHPNKPIKDSCKLFLKIQKLFGKSVCQVEAREKICTCIYKKHCESKRDCVHGNLGGSQRKRFLLVFYKKHGESKRDCAHGEARRNTQYFCFFSKVCSRVVKLLFPT